jgi:hypothetical protein
MRSVTRRFGLAAAIVGLVVGAAGQASAGISLDFTGYADGTAITSAQGVTFSLIGGQDSSGPPTTYDGGLTNSTHGGGAIYPTANILDFNFSSTVSDVSFVFNNVGFSPGGRGASYYQAFDANGLLLQQGSLNGANDQTFALSATGIKDLQFNNGTGGTSSWWFKVDSLSANVDPVAAPEPSTLISGGIACLAGLGYGWRRRRAKAVA